MPDFLEITVGPCNADLTGDTNTVIQAAVDRVAAAGRGTVKILPGKYIMHDSLHLRSDVSVEGSGSDTVLWKPPSVSSPLIYFLGYGHYDVSVADPDLFETGSGICVSDLDAFGFYKTTATVTGKSENELFINRMLNHDYLPSRNGRVVSVFPVISGQHILNAAVRNLTVDGNAAENEYTDGCRSGGVFLLQAHNTKIQHITVKNYNGDAISFQQCRDTLIENCVCTENTGSGLHPGSGSVGAEIKNIVCKNNKGDGIFYCLRVSYSLCENCIIEGNMGNGISIGHRDTDAIIRGNIIMENGGHGIYFRKDDLNRTGCRTEITKNSFRHNGKSGIYFDSPADEISIYENSGLDESKISGAKNSFLNGIIYTKKDMKIGPGYADSSSSYHLGK